MADTSKSQGEFSAVSMLDRLMAGKTGKRAGSRKGGNGGSLLAGVDSRKYASAKAVGRITVTGYGEIMDPAALVKVSSATGQRVAISFFGAQIRQGVFFVAASSPTRLQYVGYGEFADYLGLVAANSGNLTIGMDGGIYTDGVRVNAPTLCSLVDVCEARRGSRYVGRNERTWTDAATNARHHADANPQPSKA